MNQKEEIKMDKDRTEICKIISKMLDNPDKYGIYPTSTAYAELEHYVESERSKALGWMHAEVCTILDCGNDPRMADLPDIISKAETNLAA